MVVGDPVRKLPLPGWLDSGPAHWQSRWEALHGDRRVQQADWLWPRRGDWMARLDDVLLETETPAVLIAHSLGCQLVASWAAPHSSLPQRSSTEFLRRDLRPRADYFANLFNWRPIARPRLPFRSLVVDGSDDPYCHPERAV